MASGKGPGSFSAERVSPGEKAGVRALSTVGSVPEASQRCRRQLKTATVCLSPRANQFQAVQFPHQISPPSFHTVSLRSWVACGLGDNK